MSFLALSFLAFSKMSPSSTGRYQSRLFNFLSQASLKLKDEGDRAFRNLKVATVWGVQILLYPVYLLVQTSQLAGKQLQQAAPEGFPQLDASNQDNQKNRSSSQTTPAADTPIQQVLIALSGGESEISNPPLAASGNEFLNFLTDTVNRVFAAWWGFKLFNNNSLARSSQPENLTLQPAFLKEKGGKLFFTPLLGEGLAESSESCALTIQLSEDVLPYTKTSISTSTQSSEVSPAEIKVQGVATLLNTRSLVLVTAENQILDILSHQQQQKLQQRISWELADYWHQLRLVQASARRSRMRLQPPVDQRNILPPVRVFWGLMAWVQRGPVAIAANVFQEITFGSTATQSPSRPATQPQESNITLHPTSFIFQLDRTVAEIEVRQQDFLANLKPGSLELEKIYQFPLQRLQTLFDKPQEQPPSPDVTDTQSLKIQALIRAAIDYFFGKGNGKLSSQETPVINSGSNREINQLKGRSWTSLFSRQPIRELAAADVADPWLTMDDLFGKTAPTKEKINNAQQTSQLSGTKTRIALPVAENTEVSVKDSIWNVVKRNLFRQNDLPQSEPATTGEIIQRKASSVTKSQKKEVVRKSKTSVARTRRLPVTSVLDATDANPNSANSVYANAIAPVTGNRFATHTPDWIEADSRPAGYVKHPLEYLLEWLDAAMVWLENLLVKIWQWANRKIKGRR